VREREMKLKTAALISVLAGFRLVTAEPGP